MKLAAETYFGKPSLGRRLGRYHLSFTVYREREEIPSHFHENAYLSVNLRCAYRERGESADMVVEAGQMVGRPASYSHYNAFARSTGLCFNIEFLEAGDTTAPQDVQIAQAGPLYFKLMAAVLGDFEEDELECLCREVLVAEREVNVASEKPVWMAKVIEKIEEEYSEPLSLELLAATASVHPNYLARKFKAVTGITVGEYLRSVRLRKAAALVAKGDPSLGEAGYRSGFYDQAHFIRCFQKGIGCRPGGLRRALDRLI